MLTAEQLKLPQPIYEGFMQILVGLELGEYAFVPAGTTNFKVEGLKPFNMHDWGSSDENQHDCGTAACIGGWLERLVPGTEGLRLCWEHAVALGRERRCENSPLWGLFMATGFKKKLCDITPSEGAKALRRYLETGRGDWEGL